LCNLCLESSHDGDLICVAICLGSDCYSSHFCFLKSPVAMWKRQTQDKTPFFVHHLCTHVLNRSIYLYIHVTAITNIPKLQIMPHIDKYFQTMSLPKNVSHRLSLQWKKWLNRLSLQWCNARKKVSHITSFYNFHSWNQYSFKWVIVSGVVWTLTRLRSKVAP